MRSHRTPIMAAVAVALMLVTTGCGLLGSREASTSEIEQSVSREIANLTGVVPDDVFCPDALPAETGANVRCTLTKDGSSIGATVTYQGESGGQMRVLIEVDDEPMDAGPAPSLDLEINSDPPDGFCNQDRFFQDPDC